MRIVCMALAFGAASPAFAQGADDDSDQRARVLYEEGTRLYEGGLYEEAVEAFKIAYALSRRPLLLYNMAQTMERIGQWDEALAALVDYRDEAPPEEMETLDSRISALQARIDEREAEKAANTPEPVVVQAPRRGPPPGAWALFATGGVGVGVGSVFTARALGARSEWAALCVDGADGLVCPSTATDLHKRDNTSSVVADVGWVVGVLGVGTGVVVTLGGRSSDLTVAAGPRGIRLGGRW